MIYKDMYSYIPILTMNSFPAVVLVKCSILLLLNTERKTKHRIISQRSVAHF